MHSLRTRRALDHLEKVGCGFLMEHAMFFSENTLLSHVRLCFPCLVVFSLEGSDSAVLGMFVEIQRVEKISWGILGDIALMLFLSHE